MIEDIIIPEPTDKDKKIDLKTAYTTNTHPDNIIKAIIRRCYHAERAAEVSADPPPPKKQK